MRIVRCAVLGLVAAVVAAVPGVTHAAGYRHFTSKALHFSIDYPSSWTASYSSVHAYETFEQSNTVALTVNYTPAAAFTIRSFTGKLIASYRKAGLATNPPVFSGKRGQFTGSGTVVGHRVILDVVTILTPHGAFSLAAAAPSSKLSQVGTIFLHMFGSFSAM